jgi:hypothetical protein
MSVENDCVSSCCGAKIRVKGGLVGSMATTMYYECTHCGKPCNWQNKKGKCEKINTEIEKLNTTE